GRGRAKPNLKLLKALQENPGISRAQLAPIAGMESAACHRQIAQLKKDEILEEYLRLNPAKLGLEAMALIAVKMQSSTLYDPFEEWVETQPRILACWAIQGEYDYIILYLAPSHRELKSFTNRLSRTKGIPKIKAQETFEVVAVVKETHQLPLDDVSSE